AGGGQPLVAHAPGVRRRDAEAARRARARVLPRADGSRVRADRRQPGRAAAVAVRQENGAVSPRKHANAKHAKPDCLSRFRAFLGLVAIACSAYPVNAQVPERADVTVRTWLDRTAIWVADRVTYTIEITCKRGVD